MSQVLELFKLTHLDQKQRRRPGEITKGLAQGLGLLNGMKDDRHGRLYRYEDRVHRRLIGLKRGAILGSAAASRLLASLSDPSKVNIFSNSIWLNNSYLKCRYARVRSLMSRPIQPTGWLDASGSAASLSRLLKKQPACDQGRGAESRSLKS